MTAPLVIRLEAALAAAGDQVSRGVIRAQLACYQARTGEFEEAERKRIELRQEFGAGISQKVSILIMCLEALLLYYRDLDPRARDWLARANLLSVGFNEGALTALTFAWLAHIDFNLGRYPQMVESFTGAIGSMPADDGTASCRLALVLGDAFAFAGLEQQSRPAYERARVLANKLGDQAAIGAMTYNRAALHVSATRLRAICSEVDVDSLAFLGMEVRSAVNYQAVAQLSSLDHLLDSACIGVLMLERRYGEAASAIDKLLSSATVPTASAELALLLADRVHSLSMLGRLEEARALAEDVSALPIAGYGPDDRALLFGALAQANMALGCADIAAVHRTAQEEALAEHQATIAKLAKLLRPFESSPAC